MGESVAKPDLYHRVNVDGSRTLLDAARAHGVRHVVFSSTAALYGTPDTVPIPETHPLRPESPYGDTKLAVEQMLRAADAAMAVAARMIHAGGTTAEEVRAAMQAVCEEHGCELPDDVIVAPGAQGAVGHVGRGRTRSLECLGGARR